MATKRGMSLPTGRSQATTIGRGARGVGGRVVERRIGQNPPGVSQGLGDAFNRGLAQAREMLRDQSGRGIKQTGTGMLKHDGTSMGDSSGG